MNTQLKLLFVICIAIFIVITMLMNDHTNTLLASAASWPRISLSMDKFEQKYPIKTTTKPINIFIHACNATGWREILQELIDDLIESGLYDACQQIYCGCSCDACNTELPDLLHRYSKIKLMEKFNDNTWENGTINTLYEFSRKEDSYILYLHTKGVRNRSLRSKYWRQLMALYVIENWRVCVHILRTGMYTVGTMMTYYPKPHYSGNFWWADSTYLRTLPFIKDVQNRMNAEYHLLSNFANHKHVSLGRERWLSIMRTGMYKNAPPPPLPIVDAQHMPLSIHYKLL